MRDLASLFRLFLTVGIIVSTHAFLASPTRRQVSSYRKVQVSHSDDDYHDGDDGDQQQAAAAAPEMHPSDVASCVRSVNYFISRKCNYQCGFCFHTQKTTHHLSLEQAVEGLQLLRRAGTEKINFAGGEPFLNPMLLGQLCQTSHELGMAVSIISNGSLITNKWMQDYGAFVDVLGVSVDSFVPETNAAIGRGGDANNKHVERVLHVRDLCHKYGIKFKMNTVVCSFNWEENMSEHVRTLAPERWKVFQVLMLRDENSGLVPGELRDARPFCVSDDEFWSFVHRHSPEFDQVMIPEPNNVMQNSYLLLDEDLGFLDCSKGGKVPSESILRVGVKRALEQSGFDKVMFEKRGGIYDWTRDRSELVLPP